MVSPGETTRDHWAFEGPYYIEHQGEHTVSERFQKNTFWSVLEGGYCIQDPFNKDHIIKVEFTKTLSVGQKYACWITQESGTQKAHSGKFFAPHEWTSVVTFISMN